jgi:cysteine desulfurase
MGDKMIYLDYSATTNVDKEVLDAFNDATIKYIGNPNSSHKLGKIGKNKIDEVTLSIKKMLNLNDNYDIIYTSGASEANNLAIKGIASKSKGKHIITTLLEHSSVIGPISYLQKLGYEIDFLQLDSNGQIDINYLKSLIKEDTILVSISSVNSEVGIKEDIKLISEVVRQYPNCIYHVDVTQSIGKHNIDLNLVDMASFSAQKFYGIKGIGGLIKKKEIKLEPIIHGGKSTTIYRSGTPCIGLIVSLEKAFEKALKDIDKKYDYISLLNDDLREFFKTFEKVNINSNNHAIPHILNISIKGLNSSDIMNSFDEEDIYISSQTACSIDDTPSRIIMALTHDHDLAKSSIRISLSYLTTKEEIEIFKEKFKIIYNNLLK